MEVRDSGSLTSSLTEQIVVTMASDGTVIDIDGNVYQTIIIGGQEWMAENLKVTHYRNGEIIPQLEDNNDWGSTISDSYCAYNNVESNVEIYGRLYNWYAVIDNKNIAPEGWHVPSDTEWQTLIDAFGGDNYAGGEMKEVGTAHWSTPNTGATNGSGFTGLPGGQRWEDGSDFYYMTERSYYWSTSEYAGTQAWSRGLRFNSVETIRHPYYKGKGFSVRCVKD